MKILYYDLTYPIGHKYFDEKIIEILSNVSKLNVLCPNDWYRKKNKNVKYFFCAKLLRFETATTLRIFINALMNTIIARRIIKNRTIDAIIIGKFDHFSMPFAIKILGTRIPLFVIHHNEIDQLNVTGIKGKIKRFFFNIYKHKVIHCVLEDFIKDYLIYDEKIESFSVCCWPHPVERELNNYSNKGLFDCVGLSTSNNQQFIENIYNEEVKKSTIKKHALHIILRSDNYNYDNGYLKIYSGWINDDVYNHYIENTRTILIAFKDGYHYRVSASIFDAFSHHIPILCNDMPLVRYYQNKYPDICHIIDGNIVDKIDFVNRCDIDKMSMQFGKFCNSHSDKKIQQIIQLDLNRIIKK